MADMGYVVIDKLGRTRQIDRRFGENVGMIVSRDGEEPRDRRRVHMEPL